MGEISDDATDATALRYDLRCTACAQTRPTRLFRLLPICDNCWRKRRTVYNMRQMVRRRKEQRL